MPLITTSSHHLADFENAFIESHEWYRLIPWDVGIFSEPSNRTEYFAFLRIGERDAFDLPISGDWLVSPRFARFLAMCPGGRLVPEVDLGDPETLLGWYRFVVDRRCDGRAIERRDGELLVGLEVVGPVLALRYDDGRRLGTHLFVRGDVLRICADVMKPLLLDFEPATMLGAGRPGDLDEVEARRWRRVSLPEMSGPRTTSTPFSAILERVRMLLDAGIVEPTTDSTAMDREALRAAWSERTDSKAANAMSELWSMANGLKLFGERARLFSIGSDAPFSVSERGRFLREQAQVELPPDAEVFGYDAWGEYIWTIDRRGIVRGYDTDGVPSAGRWTIDAWLEAFLDEQTRRSRLERREKSASDESTPAAIEVVSNTSDETRARVDGVYRLRSGHTALTIVLLSGSVRLGDVLCVEGSPEVRFRIESIDTALGPRESVGSGSAGVGVRGHLEGAVDPQRGLGRGDILRVATVG